MSATATKARPSTAGRTNGAKSPKKADTEATADGVEAHLERFKGEALDAVRSAVMMVDRDLVLYYMNESARRLMKTAEHAFQEIWPGFDADNLIGQCIDQFHADPSHQRRILDDPSRLPYKADIEVAGNKLPDPALLFLILMLLTWGLSAMLAGVEFTEINPRTGEAVGHHEEHGRHSTQDRRAPEQRVPGSDEQQRYAPPPAHNDSASSIAVDSTSRPGR